VDLQWKRVSLITNYPSTSLGCCASCYELRRADVALPGVTLVDGLGINAPTLPRDAPTGYRGPACTVFHGHPTEVPLWWLLIPAGTFYAMPPARRLPAPCEWPVVDRLGHRAAAAAAAPRVVR